MPPRRIISADSHTLEPPDLWIQTIGDKYGDDTPRVVEEYRGHKDRVYNATDFIFGSILDRFSRLDVVTADLVADNAAELFHLELESFI